VSGLRSPLAGLTHIPPLSSLTRAIHRTLSHRPPLRSKVEDSVRAGLTLPLSPYGTAWNTHCTCHLTGETAAEIASVTASAIVTGTLSSFTKPFAYESGTSGLVPVAY
jgi:hypothetical protein